MINGSFSIGAAIGATFAIVLAPPRADRARPWLAAGLSHRRLPRPCGVRDADVDSGKSALADDPWPSDAAHAIVDEIERSSTGQVQDQQTLPKIRLRMRDHTPLGEVAHTLFSAYRQRSLVGLVLMVAQAFFYNAIFFTFALILTDFFGIPANHVGWYILPFRRRHFLGPLLLGRRPTRWAAGHDHADLWRLGHPARGIRLSVLDRCLERADTDDRMDGDFLFCLAGGKVLPISPSARRFRWKFARSRSPCSTR